jgi:AraC-like DNA-binding protein
MFSTSVVEFLAISLVWQAILFAAIFLGIHNNTKRYPKKFIAWFMLANAGYYGITWLGYFGQTQIMRYLYPFALPLLLSHLPFFYWYIRTLTDVNFRVTGKQWMHLLPGLIIMLLQFTYFLLPDAQSTLFLDKETLSEEYSNIGTLLSWLNSFSFYVIFTFQFAYYIMKYRRILKLYRNRIGNVFSNIENIDLRWLRTLMVGVLLFFVGSDLSHVIGLKDSIISALFFSTGMIAINFYIGYHCLVQSDDFSNLFSSGNSNGTSINQAVKFLKSEEIIEEETDTQRYKRSSLKMDDRIRIIDELEATMKEEELFANTKLTIDDLAQRLGVNSKYLSQSINEAYNRNFYIYINELRVEKAKKYLCTESHANYSIEGIAQQVGFQSKSSFYTAFKKITGLTPSAYREKVLNESSVDQNSSGVL